MTAQPLADQSATTATPRAHLEFDFHADGLVTLTLMNRCKVQDGEVVVSGSNALDLNRPFVGIEVFAGDNFNATHMILIGTVAGILDFIRPAGGGQKS